MLAMHHLRLLFVGLSALLSAILVWTLVSDHRQVLERDRLATRDLTRPVGPPVRPEPEQAQGARPVAPAAPRPDATAAARKKIVDRITQAAEYRDFRDRFAAHFSGDWTRALDVMSQRPEDSQIDTPDSYVLEALKTLRRGRGALAAKSDAPMLGAIFEQQMRLLAALSATDKRLCVDYLFGEESRGFLSFASSHRGLVAAMAGATLDAILDGSVKRIDRPAPSDADFAELEKVLTQRGLGAAEIEALLDGRHPNPPIADDRLCDAGLVYLDVLKQMPDETRTRIYALAVELMSRN